jgi:O-antigen biosynthesis protein
MADGFDTTHRRTVRPLAFVVRAAALAFGALRERRLPLSPSRWLLDLQHLRGEMGTNRAELPRRRWRRDPGTIKAAVAQTAMTELLAFLDTPATLACAPTGSPMVSAVLVLHNRAELTLRCIRALLASRVPLELVVVDNASTDLTSLLLERLDGAVIVRSETNQGFGAGVNEGARRAQARYLLLVNNDAEVLPGSIEAAVRRLESAPDIAAVGGKLILPDGRLQEAGTIVWNDGSCGGYGRDDSPAAPWYAFARDVDFCSAALLLTRRDTFSSIGGFDRAFDPAYYEDADYCVTLWEQGWRVVYEPETVAIHFEFASSGSIGRASQLQAERRTVFVAKHRAWLQTQLAPSPQHIVRARHRTRKRRILVFDDRVPHLASGFGFPRAVELLRHLVGLGHFVTFYPLSVTTEPWASVYEDLPRTVEVITGHGPERVRAFLGARERYYDTIIVSRSHNLQRLRARLGDVREWGAAVIYDAEAVTALRDADRERLTGRQAKSDATADRVREELALARGADVVLAVSDIERQAFLSGGASTVTLLRHACAVDATPTPPERRAGILFVGAFDVLSPNADSVLWFAREVLPRLAADAHQPVPFVVAGQNPPAAVLALEDATITVVPNAANLRDLYDAARMFVAPTRWAAGIPLKIVHAAAHGVPVVCTSLLARQLGWVDGEDLLVADTPEQFARACLRLYTDDALWRSTRDHALHRVASEYAPRTFAAALDDALEMAHRDRPSPPA